MTSGTDFDLYRFLNSFKIFSFRQNGSLGTVLRRNCQYFSDRRKMQLATRRNLFLYKTEVDQYANVVFLWFLAAVSAWLKHNL